MPPDSIVMTAGGVENGEVECWIRPAARCLLRASATTSVAKIGLIRRSRDVACALPSGTVISNVIREQERKYVLKL